MTTIISVANQKGGVGKTTTAVTIAHGLAMQGRRVLIMDLDPQGHVAYSLGLEKAPGLYRLLVNGEMLAEVVTPARENLDAVLGDKSTEAAKRYVTTLDFRENVLRQVLADVTYEVVILDMAPSLDVLHIAALVVSNWVVTPTKLDALAIDGVNEILRSIAEVSRQGYPLKGYSILPTFFDRTTRETITNLQELVRAFPANVWPPISQDTRAREAAAYGQTLWEYRPNTTSVIGYENREGKHIGGYTMALDRILEVIENGI